MKKKVISDVFHSMMGLAEHQLVLEEPPPRAMEVRP
jgi:hypothetical protein